MPSSNPEHSSSGAETSREEVDLSAELRQLESDVKRTEFLTNSREGLETLQAEIEEENFFQGLGTVAEVFTSTDGFQATLLALYEWAVKHLGFLGLEKGELEGEEDEEANS